MIKWPWTKTSTAIVEVAPPPVAVRERAEFFRITTNGLWYRIEYNWNSSGRPDWGAANAAECFSNIPSTIWDLGQARRICAYLKSGGEPTHFKVVPDTGVEL